MPSIAQQLQHARNMLAPVAKANAALEARLLAAHAWGMVPEDLVREAHNERDDAALKALLGRRLASEPVAQILGSKEFWKSSFRVTRDVLTPRADSETLIEVLLKWCPEKATPLRMLDLGTGSGCLILSALSEYPQALGVAVDASPAALAIAAHNAAALHLQHRVTFLHSDWCAKVEGRFDAVLANPPYIARDGIATLDEDVRDYEPHRALDGGPDGLTCYRDILGVSDRSADQSLTPLRGLMAGSPGSLCEHLNPGALVLFEVGMGQADDVAALAVAQGFTVKEIVADLAGIPRVVALNWNHHV